MISRHISIYAKITLGIRDVTWRVITYKDIRVYLKDKANINDIAITYKTNSRSNGFN